MAATCYICGARTRNKANLTCGFDACKAEHVRRHPEAEKKKSYLFNPPSKHKKNLLYNSKLEVQ